MTVAARVVLAPPARWSEDRLLDAARSLAPPAAPLRVGDEVHGLVVLRVEPHAGAAPDARTAFELQPRPRPDRGPLQLAALLDVSASMATPWDKTRSRLDAAREALLEHLRSPGRSHASVLLLTFARDAHLAAGPFPPSALAKGSVDLPEPAGPARPAAALDATLERLAALDHEGPQAIVLLTDGAGEVRELERVAQRAARLGVAVHVVAFAPELDPALAKLAAATGGATHVAELPLTFEITRRITP